VPAEDLEVIPGCWVDPSLVTPGQAFALETVSAFFQLFLAFGLGLDPRNNGAIPAALAPFLVGASAALTLFVGALARPGYLGASINPARCLGLNAASGHWTYHYIFWTGDIAAVM
jgi:glycerol uptake facilitator-like aquaporin